PCTRTTPYRATIKTRSEAMGVRTTVKPKQSQMFLLDRAKKRSSCFASLHPRVVSSVTELRDSVAHASGDSLWVSYASDLTDALVKSDSLGTPSLVFRLFVHALDDNTIPALSSFFRRFAFTPAGGFIPAEELIKVLETDKRFYLYIGR